MSAELKSIIAQKDAEIERLRLFLNEALQRNAARDTFVRWFATEYGLETFGREPAALKPGKFGLARWVGWLGRLMGGTKPIGAIILRIPKWRRTC